MHRDSTQNVFVESFNVVAEPRADAELWSTIPLVAAVDVRSEIVIARPAEEVADFAANPDNAPTWYVNIKSVEWKSPRPVAIGSRVAFVAYFLGRRLAYTYEIVELIPRQRLVMRTAEGPFPMETTYTSGRMGDGACRMILRNRGIPSGFFALLSPLMSSMMRRATRKDLARLKRLLEACSPCWQ